MFQSGLLQLTSSHLCPWEFFPKPQLLLAPWGFKMRVRRHEEGEKQMWEKWTCTLGLAFSAFACVWPSDTEGCSEFSCRVLTEAEIPSGDIQRCVIWYRMPISALRCPGSAHGNTVNPSPIPTWDALGQALKWLSVIFLFYMAHISSPKAASGPDYSLIFVPPLMSM